MEPSKLHKKLRLHDKSNICVLEAPNSFLAVIKDLSFSTEVDKTAAAIDAVLIFAPNMMSLERLLAFSAKLGPKDVLFWACYPKLSSALKSDISRDGIFHTAQQFGLRPVTQVAIDDTWSAMRLRPHDRVGK
ncbi:MAG: hypothetical protein HRU41_29950 [Saprospiraceae bacterium]|nr:hypothetical protein [Saprospiraceae bacterium]